MRIKIKFKLPGNTQILPLSYQYAISAWIYKVLHKSDAKFADMLHAHGYQTGSGKQFKLFTFSKLQFPKHTWEIIPDSGRMKVWARNSYLTISFQLPQQIENFVIGLFKDQRVFIGDKISGINMEVENIEALSMKSLNFVKSDSVVFKAQTPIVLGVNIEGKKNEQYVPPTYPQYKDLFLKNLIDKYNVTGGNGISASDLDFKVTKIHTTKTGKPKTELQIIKPHTPAQTKVRGYYFDFELTAPKEVLEVGLSSGFGSMNALGFGFCGVRGD